MNAPNPPATLQKYHHGDLKQELINAGVAIVNEEQNWNFSLRQVARRAGVSHNAPYNHFGEKRDLLDAVAATGFDALKVEMEKAMRGKKNASTALSGIAAAYVAFAAKNPALYRLMFGPELAGPDGVKPPLVEISGAGAKSVLRDVIVRGAAEGLFTVSVENEQSVATAVLSVWSTVHGLSTLVVDGKSDQAADLEVLVEGVMRHLLEGLLPR